MLSVVVTEIPSPVKLLITSALIVLPSEPVERVRPFSSKPAFVPSRSMRGAVGCPGWEEASMSTGTLMPGRADATPIVQTPVVEL